MPAYRYRYAARVGGPGHGSVTGDAVSGGKWFSLTEDHGQAAELGRLDALTEYAWAARAGGGWRGRRWGSRPVQRPLRAVDRV